MYKPPFTVIINDYIDEMSKMVIKERENSVVAMIQQQISVDIDKEELMKCLNYDRMQYNAGFADAKALYSCPEGGQTMTNKEKFEQVFGCEPNTLACPFVCSCDRCEYSKNNSCYIEEWWQTEYKEIKNE